MEPNNTTQTEPVVHEYHTQNPQDSRYQGWLNSNSFIKRAVATYLYSAVGWFIIFFPLFLIFFVIAMVLGFSGLQNELDDSRVDSMWNIQDYGFSQSWTTDTVDLDFQ